MIQPSHGPQRGPRARGVVALALVSAVVLAAAPAIAVGPNDGVYQLVESSPSFGSFTGYASVHQNDTFLAQGFNIVIGFMRGNGTWSYGLGVRSGNTIQGTSYTPNGQTYATWTVTISGNTISGSSIETGYPVTITAVRVF